MKKKEREKRERERERERERRRKVPRSVYGTARPARGSTRWSIYGSIRP